MGQKMLGAKKTFKIAYKNTFRAVSTTVGRPLHWAGGGTKKDASEFFTQLLFHYFICVFLNVYYLQTTGYETQPEGHILKFIT